MGEWNKSALTCGSSRQGSYEFAGRRWRGTRIHQMAIFWQLFVYYFVRYSS
jgi:hypothetical protein